MRACKAPKGSLPALASTAPACLRARRLAAPACGGVLLVADLDNPQGLWLLDQSTLGAKRFRSAAAPMPRRCHCAGLRACECAGFLAACIARCLSVLLPVWAPFFGIPRDWWAFGGASAWHHGDDDSIIAMSAKSNATSHLCHFASFVSLTVPPASRHAATRCTSALHAWLSFALCVPASMSCTFA